ncbi:MAG: hypothetical protein HONBIEJF_00837 [Fimbriimonadaceae bacterium]|nr:hypothetical protein [Fimbriimonadaceae bacterium]
MVPIVALMIPIVAILTQHQRRMAEIIHANPPNQLPSPEVEALRSEIRELKSLVHQQAIAIDNLAALRQPAESRSIETRLSAHD